ncbi:hypothetical protein ACU4GD_46085 [Cupriavidus basilensis]
MVAPRSCSSRPRRYRDRRRHRRRWAAPAGAWYTIIFCRALITAKSGLPMPVTHGELHASCCPR